MAVIAQKRSVSSVHPRRDDSGFRMPNPGDVFLLVAFGWSTLCLLLVVGDTRLVGQLARLSGSAAVRDLILNQQTAVAGVMILGLVGLGASFYFLNRFRELSIGLFIVSMGFANALYAPVHDPAFAFKYLVLIYLGAYGFFFFIRNGWRLIEMPYYRMLLVYIGWTGLIALINGFKIADVWYLGTEFALVVGFAMAWLGQCNDREQIERYCRIFAIAGVAALVLNLLSLIVMRNYTTPDGRFVSMFGRATGFATIFSLYVVAMFWMAMYETRPLYRNAFLLMATIGYGLILWSGTRNATVAVALSIGILWWVFRSKIFIYIGFVGIVGFLIQLILGGVEDISYLSDRLRNTSNSRLGAWEFYWGLAMKSPIFGYGPDGLAKAVYGETVVGLIRSFRNVVIPGTHNFYIGLSVRYGLVGMVIVLFLFTVSFYKAYRVIMSQRVSLADKKVYVLPVALLALVASQGLFEDTIGSTGKGTLHGVVFGSCILILCIWGDSLLRASREQLDSVTRRIAPERSRQLLAADMVGGGGVAGSVVSRNNRQE